MWAVGVMNTADEIWAGAAGTQGAGPQGGLSRAAEATWAAWGQPGKILEERPARVSPLKAPPRALVGGTSPSPGQGNGAPEKPRLHHSPWKRISVTEPDGGGNWDTVRKRGL